MSSLEHTAYPGLEDDADLLRMSTQIEREFIESLTLGITATSKFAERFAQFERVAQAKILHGSLESDSAIAVHTVASNISAVAEGLINANEKADDLSAELIQDINDVLDALSLETDAKDLHPSTKPSSSSKTHPSSSVHLSSQYLTSMTALSSVHTRPNLIPDYRAPCAWLLKHLHSPYPNLSTRKTLAQQSNVTTKALNEWFTHTRRRIGWTSISKSFFEGNRQLTADGARRVLLEGTGHCYFPEEVIRAFEDMKLKAERLLEGRRNESDLARRLIEVLDVDHSLPAASYSPTSDSVKSRKRGRNHSEAEGAEGKCANEEVSRSSKRRRTDKPLYSRSIFRKTSLSTSISSRASTAELMTPASQTISLPIVDTDESIDRWLSSISCEPIVHKQIDHPTAESSSRKRCLSEQEIHPTVKRARRTYGVEFGNGESADKGINPTLSEDNSLLQLLAQFDFNVPTTALIDYTLNLGEPLRIESFDYASMARTDVPHSLKNDLCSYNLQSPNIDVSYGDINCTSNVTAGTPSDSADSQLQLPVRNLSFTQHDSYEATCSSYLDNIYTPIDLSRPEFAVDLSLVPSEVATHTTAISDSSAIAKSAELEFWNLEVLNPPDAAKLDRINQLLAEAAKLQQEVITQA